MYANTVWRNHSQYAGRKRRGRGLLSDAYSGIKLLGSEFVKDPYARKLALDLARRKAGLGRRKKRHGGLFRIGSVMPAHVMSSSTKMGMAHRRKRSHMGSARRMHLMRMLRGRGLLGDLWSGIKDVGKKVISIVKPSQIAKLAGNILPGATTVGNVLGKVGLGRRRRRVGGNISVPIPVIGLGRRKVGMARHRKRGRGIIGALGSLLGLGKRKKHGSALHKALLKKLLMKHKGGRRVGRPKVWRHSSVYSGRRRMHRGKGLLSDLVSGVGGILGLGRRKRMSHKGGLMRRNYSVYLS